MANKAKTVTVLPEALEEEYFISGGQLYKMKDFGLFVTGELVKVRKAEDPLIWKGAKLPLQLYFQILAFFHEAYEIHKAEQLIYLYYDVETPGGRWMLWAPPQFCVGMTVKSNHEAPEYKTQRELIPERYVQMGTFHHHCTGSAFASGTDKDDEADRDGLHVTIGGLGQKTQTAKPLTIDARVTFRGETRKTDILRWIELPEWLSELPPAMAQQVITGLLTYPLPMNHEFPKEWLDNVKKTQYDWNNKDYGFRSGSGGYYNPTGGGAGQGEMFPPSQTGQNGEAGPKTKRKTNPVPVASVPEIDRKDMLRLFNILEDENFLVDVACELLGYDTSALDEGEIILRQEIIKICANKGLYMTRVDYLGRAYDLESFYEYFQNHPEDAAKLQ